MEINSKNVVGWLRLITKVVELPTNKIKAIESFINRTDTVRRQKEIDRILGE